MGTNTMVAAVGLVIGPVLGGALVATRWHWVFWFNVPFGLAGQPVGVAGPARDHRPLGGPLVRLRSGTITFLIGLTGLVYGISQGRDLGLGLAAGDRRPDRCRRSSCPLFVLIERHQKAPMLDLSIFQQPPVLDRRRRRVLQRPGALRADVRVRLLLPGRAGRLADPGGRQAGAAGGRDADLLAARRHLGRPPRLAHAGRRSGCW